MILLPIRNLAHDPDAETWVAAGLGAFSCFFVAAAVWLAMAVLVAG